MAKIVALAQVMVYVSAKAMEAIMCFGPSAAERAAARAQREAAEQEKRQQIEERAQSKREDISEALSASAERRGRAGGAGRRSLFTSSSGGAGYASRF